MNQKLNKQFLFLFALFFLASGGLHGQTRYGIKAGVNITNLTKVNGISKSRTGFQAGGLVLFLLDNNDQFYLQPELIYSMQGEYLVGKDGDNEEYKNFLNYINIPIMLKAYLSEAESEFFAEAGPFIGFKIGENIERLDNPGGGQKFNTFDFGIGAGFGYSFSREFEIGARYSYGLSDAVKNDWENTGNHTSVLNFGVSYIFY